MIVDEEQRFGVEHKEQMKAVRASVDVLSMSATPIPRTLEMSLTGLREMSVIATPPEERHPVLTFVGAYEDLQVSAAIRRELLREGQVFYIHNRVESIDRAAARLRELVPEARIAVAHGQMHEDLLEQVMVGFWEKAYDVLVCTTIVESGLDIPNANTLVVERADAFGLSQLHQLRGRVGRGRDRAYAYFLYPTEKPLTELAYDRLATIAQNADLGGGMAIAMKDLEIRGAGNLLGGEQSGHIAGVGFDLYVRMVGEAVRDFREGRGGDEAPEPTEIKVELPIDAHLPHDYVPSERLRLEAYRRLAEAATHEAVDAVRDELRDRYGPPPLPVENLLAVAAFRVEARRYGVRDVGLAGNQVRFAPLELRESQTLRLTRLFKGAVVKPAIRQVLVPRPTDSGRIGGTPLRDVALLDWARALLEAVVGDSIGQAAAVAAGQGPVRPSQVDPADRALVKRSLLAASVAALLTTGVLAGCSHPYHAGAAATVGEDRISTDQLRTMVDRGFAGIPASVTTKPERVDIERLDLGQLIQLAVLKQMAKDLKAVPVTDAQIDGEITTAAQSSSLEELQANAAAQGVDPKTLRIFAEVVAYQKAVITAPPISQQALQQAYDSAKASTYEEVHVAHILVATKAEADSIYAQLQADPSKFAALAAQYSTDTGSKANGGDLGFANRGAFVKEFSDAAFAGKDGTIVGPVQSQFGFHIIQVIAHRTISFEDASPALRLSLNSDAFVDAYKKAAAALSISVNPRFGAWVADGGQDGLGDVEASDKGDLSSPVAPAPTASGS